MEITKHIEYLSPVAQTEKNNLPKKKPIVLSMVQFGFSTLGRVFPKQAGNWAYRLFSTPRIRAKHKVSDPVLEKARLFEFMYGKQILKGYSWGDSDKHILLVHGWESRGTALRSFVPPLVAEGYRVIAFDGPAHGNSGGKRTNLIHFSGAVRAIINQIGSVKAVIAHSFGGASTIFTLSQLDPQIQLDKLILIAVPNKISDVLQEAANTLKLSKAATNRFYNIIEQKLQTSKDQIDISKAYGKVQINDLLIVHDKQDTVVDFSNAENIFESWENANLLISQGLGHYKLVKNPELIEKVVQFIHPIAN